jgi:hypothetical protein
MNVLFFSLGEIGSLFLYVVIVETMASRTFSIAELTLPDQKDAQIG